MRSLRQVVWSEGILLSQQHFQLWDDYIHARQDFHREILSPFSWGLIRLEVSPDALKSGVFQVETLEAIMPDGTVVLADDDTSALSCEVEIGTDGYANIFLAIPNNDYVSGITGYKDNGRISGYIGSYQNIDDRYDPDRSREVLVSQPHAHLLSDSDSRDAFVSFQLARLKQSADRSIVIDESFVPPILQIKASPSLRTRLERLIDVIHAKVRGLAERRKQHANNIAEFSSADSAHFWLLNNLNSVLPALFHCSKHPEFHPERIYIILCQLYGSLCSFSADTSSDKCPSYEHTGLGDTFDRLESSLRKLIDTVIPANFSIIKMKRESELLHVATQIDWNILESGEFFLAVTADLDDDWVQQFQKVVKIGSRDSIETIVSAAMPGVTISHETRPPGNLPLRSTSQYFRVNTKNDYWKAIASSGTIAIYLPQSFSSVDMELVGVQGR